MFIDRKVVVLHRDDTVLQAALAMCRGHVGCVLVVDHEAHFCGMVTDRDIVCNLIAEGLDSETKLEKIMETDVISLQEDSTIDEAVELMKANGIRRLPIIEDLQGHKQRCIGMLTLDDLIAGEFIHIKDLSDIIRSQIFRKKKILKQPQAASTRSDQTYNRFISQISEHTELDKNKTKEVTQFLLGSIVRRLHYTGGAHFISQLPKHLQEELFELPAGPDRTVTEPVMIQGVNVLTGRSTKDSKVFIRKFWGALCKIIGTGETDHVLNQLPLSLRLLLEGPVKSTLQKQHHSPKKASGGENWSEFE